MKNILKYIWLILLFLIAYSAFSDDFDLENVPKEYIGTYIPIQYNNILISTRSHYEAMLSNKNQYHDILLLNDNICYSNSKFHDGYAIQRGKFKYFNFVTNENGKYIIDDNGNSYRRISENVGNEGYIDFVSYVVMIIFEDAQELKNISLDNDKVIINNTEFEPLLDSLFLETDGVSIWLRGDEKLYAIVLDEVSAKLVESKREGISNFVSENIVMEFPLFYWNDKQYPQVDIWNMSQDSLRYMRNLIYAKHGYMFRSEDLRILYDSFSWYKKNPSFTEDDFSENEKKLLDRILKRENR